MNKHFADYYWRQGLPQGRGVVAVTADLSYKIIADPYHKHISIEKYLNGFFAAVVYDSALLDYRHLEPHAFSAWERTLYRENKEEEAIVYMLRDNNDRLRYFETNRFCGLLCRQCLIHTPQGILLARHELFYELFADGYNGVELYDSNDHLVLRKKYAFNQASQSFAELLEEQWEHQGTRDG